MRRLFSLPARRALLAVATACAAAACSGPDPTAYLIGARVQRLREGLPEVETPGVVQGEVDGGALTREVLRLPDGSVLRHGTERVFWPDGAWRAVREFERGEPTGEWRAWYPDGTPRMSYVHSDGPTPMVFHHPNGVVSARGDAVQGRRVGRWEFFDEGGAPSGFRDHP